MDPYGTQDSNVHLKSTLTIGKKPFNFTLTNNCLSWNYKRKQPSEEKCTTKLKNIVAIGEIIAVDYVEKEPESSRDGIDIEMISINSTAFKLHTVKRGSKNVWRVKTVVVNCSSSSQCALWVDSIRSLVEKRRPKSLLIFVNPYGGQHKAQSVYETKVAPLFNLAGITSHVIVTERAGHAKEYIQTHDPNRYDGLICVGGDGMFAELLNGLLILHNTCLGVNLDDSQDRLTTPDLRLGIIPAGSTDTVSYCTNGINDVVTSALHIIVGDSMAIDVCSVRSGISGKLLRFCVSMLSYGYFGDVMKDSENYRWMGPRRYDFSGVKSFLRNRSYKAAVTYLPAHTLHENHHPGLESGSRCYSGCNICQSASLLDLNGSMVMDKASATGIDMYSRLPSIADEDADGSISFYTEAGSDSISDVSVANRPISSISTDSWRTISGKFIYVNSHTISCRCARVPEGVSPACHLGDGSLDLVFVHDTSRLNYLRHLLSHSSKRSSQFDFGFVEVVRAKAFKLRANPSNMESVGTEQQSASFHRLESDCKTSAAGDSSCWSCDGEVIEEPNVDVRVHCQLIKVFARGIDHPEAMNQCATNCMPCASV